MRYLLLVYIDEALLDALPADAYAARMRECLHEADRLQADGTVLGCEQLEPPATARSVRVRDGRLRVTDGPFAETKEVLAGFNLVEAASADEALRLAQALPWAAYGCIEVRPVRDLAAVRAQVGA